MNSKPHLYAQTGFSLIEMAMVLLILGALLGGLFVSIGQSITNLRINTTERQLELAQEALYGYAQANGRLPCPATNSSSGKESPPLTGNCAAFHGFLPATTLGLSGSVNQDGLFLDAWQNPIRYSVANYNPSGIAFTSTTGVSYMFNNPADLNVGNMLTVCSDSTNCSNTALTDTAPAVIFSMGANWGSLSAGSSANERENSGNRLTTLGVYPVTNTNDFVSTGYSEQNFDDIIVWISPHIFYSRLIKAGQLP